VGDILFVTWDGGGNVPPALGIARELQSRGHTVRFLGHASQADALAGAAFEVAPSRAARPFSSLAEQSPVSFMATFGDRGMGRDLLDAVAARPADLVVIDCMMFGALDAAREAGLSYAVLEHFYDGYYERGCLRGPLGLSLRLRRLAPRRALAAAAGRIVAALPQLDEGAPSSAALTYTGPVVDVAPARDQGAEPMVLVSLSSFAFAGMAASLEHLVDAAARLDAKVVVTTGNTLTAADLRVPDGVEILGFVPHVELMPHASLLVGHGGHGTSMQALAHDLPVVVIPMDARTDQPMVGRSLEKAGAGRVVPKSATADELTPVLASLLADGPHRAAAARLGTAIRALPGATRGADAIEELLGGVKGAASGPGPRAARP
jgi:UDP:flavonoid glycosyltransferase YjiC (YdhE family)